MLDYTNRAASYDKRWQSYCLASFSRSLDLIHLKRDEELLDIACGTGIFLEKVEREHPYVTLTGVDSNQAMLNEAVKKVSEKVI
nr:methyltransferase domain-containing protein [Gammaproteobacteria bacterium]